MSVGGLLASVLLLTRFSVEPCYLPLSGNDKCDGVVCRPGAKCVLSQTGDDPKCVCPTSCPDYGDHSGSRPLCGSDGVDYKDMCSFNVASCAVEGGLQIKYHGPCDPCAGVSCPPGETCLVTEGRVARCSCPEQCPLDHAPVCASDGRTFTNECHLRADACKTRRKIRVLYRGSCEQGLNPCAEVKCEHGARCEVDDQGRASCSCGPPCEEVMRPVCGSDGQTHPSLCHLKREACLNRTDLRMVYSGRCGGEGPCQQKECPPPSVCTESGGTARCECPSCPGDYQPVCGSDGISYSNQCKLERQACLHSRPIKPLYQGLCNGCESKKCEHYASCQIDSSGDANCICPEECSEETRREEVCGSDGKTYTSECELKRTSCLNKMALHVTRRGPCVDTEEECPRDCSSSPVEQVCGSDLNTYPNQCELQRKACETRSTGLKLEVLFYGSCQHRGPVHPYTTPLPGGPDPEEACRGVRCQFSATCELDPSGYPRCACRFNCPSSGTPVCGSDLVLYQNKCEMESAGCTKQMEIRIRPLDLCKGLEVKPCGGDEPLKDPETGEDLDCGNGHNRQDCPSDYYCHQTPQFAKCCRKESGVYLKDCADSWFGCCPDGKTPAQGPEEEGCPSMCGCNKIGSYSDWCDKETGICECRPGVGGPKCDRCEPGYWGLPKISSGYKGCLPCGCSLFGSVREDCEQMTGRCVCKPGVSGHKCDTCPIQGQILTPAGCTQADLTTPVPTSCTQLICYFGAVCEERGGRASCVCTATCPNHDKQQVVCGSDGQTYGSECQLKLYACKYQKDIAVQSLGACKVGEETISGTEGPVRRWTSYSQYTLPDDVASPLSKSTRHLLTEKYQLPGKSRDVYIVEGHATSAGVELGATLGQPCSYDADCTVTSSICKGGICTCNFAHVESEGRCISEESPSFTGTSWMRLRKLKAYHKFSLELEFLSYNEDGILFYTQQHQDGTGDFISLALVNGHVVLNYNLGSGTVSVPSLGRVSLGTWHSVKVRRYQRDALLQVDNEQGVRGQSQGTLTGLDLDDHAYLGYVPTNFTKVFLNAGTHIGLTGCLRAPGLEPEESHMIGSSCLHNPCRGVVCHNHGSCIVSQPRPVCACQPDFTGKHCEEKLNPCVYSVCVGGTECIPIEGGGFDCVCTSREAPCALQEETDQVEIGPEPLILPRLEGVSRAFALSITFAMSSVDGTLLYNGQTQNTKGDFLSLKVAQGRLVFSFSLGGNPVSIVTKEKIEAGEWHTARVSRLDKEGFLRLDSGRVYRSVSVGHHLELNLDHPLYIGAPPFDEEEWPAFNGAVKTFMVNGHRLILSGARPCTLSFCSINATSSSLCEGCGTIENEAIHFDGNTVVKYPQKPLKRNGTEVEEEDDGDGVFDDLLYEDNYTEDMEEDVNDDDMYETYDDYQSEYDVRHKRRSGMRIEVSLKSGGPDGALILGKDPQGHWGLVILDNTIRLIAHQVEVISKVIVTDGRWHRISALRRRKSLSLRVDRENLLKASLPTGIKGTTKRYYIGGSPGGGENLYPGFQGCVRGLRIDGRLVELEGRSCPVS